jgi:hypothetical protein
MSKPMADDLVVRDLEEEANVLARRAEGLADICDGLHAKLAAMTAERDRLVAIANDALDKLTASEAAQGRLREALVLAEDALSRAPFSTMIWPSGLHPNTGITLIREALADAPHAAGEGEK